MESGSILCIEHFHPYKFETNLSKFRNELLLIGVTYYDRMMVFKHLNNCPISQIANHEIDRVELGFMSEDLVSVWFYLSNENSIALKEYLESLLKIVSIENKHQDGDKMYTKILNYWRDDKYFLGIGKDTNGLHYVYITKINHALHLINN